MSVTEQRLAVVVSGVVQGVGFRPFVYALACRNRLAGFVRNNNGSVQIEVQGSEDAITDFLRSLRHQAPPLAEITGIDTQTINTKSEPGFRIDESFSDVGGNKLVPPDAATCGQCLAELFDPDDRRFRYPFINCVNCGPRFTIIKSLPYDRRATTMESFAMCSLCRAEYNDPANRRFHAQPNACSNCGPTLTWWQAEYHADGEDALQLALQQLGKGDVIAVKGLGGFHLICDAQNVSAIEKLRRRKGRSRKPFALMMADLEMVRLYCRASAQEELALLAPARPIVLLDRADAGIPDQIAPGSDRLGVMLPYTPLHHLIMCDYARPLVATSANLSEEPIVIDNIEARRRLVHLADGFLEHDRDIHCRFDDSIVHLVAGQQAVLRRARGLAPAAIKLPFRGKRDVIAFGAHLKNTFCLIHDDQAFVSQHIGDLENLEAEEHLQKTLQTHLQLFAVQPELVAHDLHPDYLSTQVAQQFAAERNLPVVPVQHHHAHIVACMTENAITCQTIGVAFDGLGLGTDGTLWGGEFLLADLADYQRCAYFEAVAMPSSQAIRQPWRMALSYILSDTEDLDLFSPFLHELGARYGKSTVEVVKKQIATRFNSAMTSSCGRLFDALSALLGVCQIVDYEGQAAIELETLAGRCLDQLLVAPSARTSLPPQSVCYPYEITAELPHIVRSRAILKCAYQDLLKGTSIPQIAARFHCTLAAIIADVCAKLRATTKINTVCLGGGVFQNRLLLSLSKQMLEAAGFKVYFPRKLPANDGGLALGQAVVALARENALLFEKSKQGD